MSKAVSDRLRFARRINLQHGVVFAERLCAEALLSEAAYDAYRATRVVAWPESKHDVTPATQRYSAIQDEILERTFDLAAPAIAAAFARAGKEVIERERAKQRRGLPATAGTARPGEDA